MDKNSTVEIIYVNCYNHRYTHTHTHTHTNITWGYKGRYPACSVSVTHVYMYCFALIGNAGIGQAYRQDLQRNENELNWLDGDINISLGRGGGDL